MSNSKKRKYDDMTCDYDSFTDIWWGFPESNKKPKTTSMSVDENQVYTIGNEIHFTCSITKETVQELIRQMTQLIHDHKKKSSAEPDKLNIVYIVDSPGGAVTSVLKFVDFVDIVKKKYAFVEFTSIITGMVASAGTIMSLAADKRFMTKNAHAMIHELSSGNNGKYTELLSYAKYLKKLHNKLIAIYCEKSGKTAEEVEELMRKETWFTAKQYLNHGFVHEIK
jgi:ATP-dependent protease ClpP protease subunit